MKRIAIVGGGTSGLSAAFSLEKYRRTHPAELEYVLYESEPRLGGVLRTEHADGCQIEAGPDSFLTEKPWASDLCRELGIGDQLIGSNDAERKTYILVKGRLIAIPDGLMFMVPTKILPTVFSPLFSVGAKLNMAREWFHPPQKAQADESVSSFVQRHYGPEMVDRLADPLLSGVYGGEAAQLSVRAVLPRFAEMEAKYGSLGRAMLAAKRRMNSGTSKSARPLFTSLKNGMQQMADSLVAQLTATSPLPANKVSGLQFSGGHWRISSARGSSGFDALILAVPTHAAATLVQSSSEQLARELAEIQYTSSITINLGFDGQVRQALPRGFGFLIPRSENKRMLACTFVHTKFPHRAAPDRALLRCFVAGANDEHVLQASDEGIVNVIRAELKDILGLAAEPLFTRVYRWTRAMAQYGVGHLEKLKRIDGLCSQLPGLFLAGNGYRGIGVPDCVLSGADAATNALRYCGVPDVQADPRLSRTRLEYAQHVPDGRQT